MRCLRLGEGWRDCVDASQLRTEEVLNEGATLPYSGRIGFWRDQRVDAAGAVCDRVVAHVGHIGVTGFVEEFLDWCRWIVVQQGGPVEAVEVGIDVVHEWQL